MEKSYLIQRLDKPYVDKIETPLQAISAYGLAATGLSQKAKEALRTVCVFDYMGSSEFEFGTIPKAFQILFKRIDGYMCQTIEVDYSYREWFSKKKKRSGVSLLSRGGDLLTGKAKVYIIAHIDDIAQVIEDIKYYAVNSYNDQNHRLKEMIHVDAALAGSESHERLQGWFDLENAFLFFKDETMFNNFKTLLGLS